MNSVRPTVLSITITFVAALAFYLVAYSWLTKRQTSKGPWTVTFTNDTAGIPELIVVQTNLGITDLHIRFADEKLDATQHVGTVEFKKPNLPIPYGTLVFDDLMFLPGTVTVDCFGHEIELLPRTLVLDRKQVAWTPRGTNELTAASKIPPEKRKQKKAGYKRSP